ncbi:MAG: hypothetical protein GY699_17540 [Desulfobacteraceae bacterium]|nr:hypothetical protein [Desulfobacteraceae bacterium]
MKKKVVPNFLIVFLSAPLSPTLPGHLSPGIANSLLAKFDIKRITTPEGDATAIITGN